MDLQHRIVRRHWLECNICVPASRGETTDVAELVGEPAALLLLLAADDADLVAELAAGFGQGVDVEGRGVGLYYRGQRYAGRSKRMEKGLTHPAAMDIRSQSSFICWGVTSWFRRKTTPRSETVEVGC